MRTTDRADERQIMHVTTGAWRACCHSSPTCTVWAQYSNLYLLAMCRANVNAAAVLAFLHSVLDVFKHYFSELEEESLRDNFVIAYELLDEVRGNRQRPAPSGIQHSGSDTMHVVRWWRGSCRANHKLWPFGGMQ